MATPVQKHNVCGILVSFNAIDKTELFTFLPTIETCEITDHTDVQLAATLEDSDIRSAYDAMELIKEHPKVLSITLVNHFFEEI